MQAMSELSKAKGNGIEDGDYINSRTEEKLLDIDGDKEFLPFIVIKTFKR